MPEDSKKNIIVNESLKCILALMLYPENAYYRVLGEQGLLDRPKKSKAKFDPYLLVFGVGRDTLRNKILFDSATFHQSTISKICDALSRHRQQYSELKALGIIAEKDFMNNPVGEEAVYTFAEKLGYFKRKKCDDGTLGDYMCNAQGKVVIDRRLVIKAIDTCKNILIKPDCSYYFPKNMATAELFERYEGVYSVIFMHRYDGNSTCYMRGTMRISHTVDIENACVIRAKLNLPNIKEGSTTEDRHQYRGKMMLLNDTHLFFYFNREIKTVDYEQSNINTDKVKDDVVTILCGTMNDNLKPFHGLLTSLNQQKNKNYDPRPYSAKVIIERKHFDTDDAFESDAVETEFMQALPVAFTDLTALGMAAERNAVQYFSIDDSQQALVGGECHTILG